MARKSLRLSGTGTPMASHKRAASTTATPTTGPKRSKAAKATPTKSPHFKDEDEPVEEDDLDESEPTEDDGEASEFDEQDDESSASEPEGEDEDDSEEDAKPRKRSTPGKSSNGATPATTKGREAYEAGVKAGLGPGKELIIKKPKARPAGKTPYEDDAIHPNTFLFLADLKANNRREWLKMNDPDFRQAERDWHSMVGVLTEKLTEIDDTIPELPVKDVVFRIYRDVRFSNDPTPYKPHFSAAWSRTGRKGPYACYYVHIAPKNSFVGGGLWHPEAAPTALMRRDIDRNAQGLKGVLMQDGVRKAFLNDAAKDEKKVVGAFAKTNAENALKTKPKGFDADHPDIALLRLRNYTVGHKLTDDEVLGEGGLAKITELMVALKPFVTYLNKIVMPDDPASADEESGEESSDGDSE